MSKSDRVPEEIKSFLRSVLISSNGVKESKVQKDYHELSGERLMWKNYGFSSLNEFLNALPDVCVLQYNTKDRENRVYGVQLEGTYMSKHAKKNVKTANTSISCAKETNAPLVNGRLVQQDGNSFKITLANDQGGDDSDGLRPNKNGLYQVYVVNLPNNCTESDLNECFQVYGNVIERQIVISSINKKVGFVRYALKNEALRALSDGKKNPPKIHGVELEVGKPKKKSGNNSNTSVSSEPSKGSLSSTSSLPIKPLASPAASQQSPLQNSAVKPLLKQELPLKSSSSSQVLLFGQEPLSPLDSTVKPAPVSIAQSLSTLNQSIPPMAKQQSNSQRPLTLNQPAHPIVSSSQGPSSLNPPTHVPVNPPFNTHTPLSVQVPTAPSTQQLAPLMQVRNTPGPWSLDPKSPTKTLLSIQQVKQHGSGVIIAGYDSKVSEVHLKKECEGVGNLERFQYQPHYSIAYFNNENAVANVVNDLNGKLIFGCVLLVKPLAGHHPILDEAKPTNIPLEEKLPEHQNEFSRIYDYHSEAMSRCCGQQYLDWLNNLPPCFEVKVMELIDPCTFWVHLSDGTRTHLEFNDLSARLSHINPSSGLHHLNKNEFGAGIFSDDDRWYRCYCLEASTDGRNLLVMYIDYGNTEWLKREKTVKLSDVFFRLRPQGVLVKLSGMRFNSNNDKSLVDSVLSSARELLIFEVFTAQKASVGSAKPCLLKIVLLHSKGESVMEELASLPGVETRPREPSPVPPLLLSAPPPVPTILKPLKARLSDNNTACVLIWITNIMSPTTFYFQVLNDESAQAIRKIQEMLLKCNIHNKVNVKDPKMSSVVCYHKNGLERSRVILFSSTGTPGKVTVLHVDTGKKAVVPLTSFIALPVEGTNIAYQARPARLFGVPHDTLARSSEALEFIIQQAAEVLRGIVVDKNADESVVMELFNSEGASVNKKLLEMARPSQNQALPSALMTSSQNRVSPSSSGQASPIQTPVQVSPNQALTQKQASPTQAFTQNQALPSQPLTNSQAPPHQNFSKASPNEAFGQKPTLAHHPFGQNQTPPPAKAFPPNQPLPQTQASPQTQPSRAFPQSNALPSQTFGQKQGSPQGQVSANQNTAQNQASQNRSFNQNRAPPSQAHTQASPQNQASLNQAFTAKQAFPQGQVSPNRNIVQNRAPQNRAQPNQAITHTQAASQNRASPNQAFTQGQVSPNQNTYSSQASQNRASLQNQAHQTITQPAPNQAYNQEPTNQQQQRPQSNQTFFQSRVSPNQAPPQNQAPPNLPATIHHQTTPSQALHQNATQSRATPTPNQPASIRKFNGPTNNLPNTADKTNFSETRSAGNATAQRPVQQNNTGLGAPMPNSRFYNAVRPNFSQKDSENMPSQRVTSQGPTPQPPASQFSAPKGFGTRDSSIEDLKSSGSTSQGLSSQGISSQTVSSPVTSQGSTSQGITSVSGTSQGITSQSGSSQHAVSQSSTSQSITPQGTTSRSFTSQGITSQFAVSQSSTSQNITSHSTTSRNVTPQGITSHSSLPLKTTSEIVTSQGTTSSPTKAGKTRSDSSASAGSKNSSNSDENWDESSTANDHEVQSVPPAMTAGPDNKTSPIDKTRPQALNKFHTTKQKLPTQSGQKPFRKDITTSGSKTKNSFGKTNTGFPDKKTKQFGAGKMAPTAESNARNFTGKGGKKFNPNPRLDPGCAGSTDSKEFQDLTEKVSEQKKVFAGPRAELPQRVDVYKSRERLELVYRVRVLENKNLVLESEIKKNLEEKAELEKQL